MRPIAGLLAILSVGLAMSGHASAAEVALATIQVDKNAPGYTFVAHVIALSDGRFEGRMTVAKSGPTGAASTSQAGVAVLRAGAGADLATVGINLEPEDTLTVTFEVLAAGAVVSRAAMTVE